MLDLERIVRAVQPGNISRIDSFITIAGLDYEVTAYRVGDLIRIDLKPRADLLGALRKQNTRNIPT